MSSTLRSSRKLIDTIARVTGRLAAAMLPSFLVVNYQQSSSAGSLHAAFLQPGSPRESHPSREIRTRQPEAHVYITYVALEGSSGYVEHFHSRSQTLRESHAWWLGDPPARCPLDSQAPSFYQRLGRRANLSAGADLPMLFL